MKFLNPTLNRLENNCCIANLDQHLANHTFFPHPVGICICPDAKIGQGVHIFQNVTIGMGKYNTELQTSAPIIGDKVVIWANAVVVKDVPANSVVAGNPAKFIRKSKMSDYRKVDV